MNWVINIIKYDSCRFVSNSGITSKLTLIDQSIDQDAYYPRRLPGRIITATSILILNPMIVLRVLSLPTSPKVANVLFTISTTKEELNGFFRIYNVSSEEGTLMDMHLHNRYLFYPGTYGTDLVGQDFQYRDRVFKECFVMDSTNSYIAVNTNSPVDRDIKKAVISKEYGLIYYSFSDGEEFFRDFE
ncbi:MAG: hypothetical protein K2L34_06720 [Muribaculaceae bacterium]|nr:hypothetical protein [Muribaculaceae bacterium]